MEIKPHASRPIKPHQLVGNGSHLSSEKARWRFWTRLRHGELRHQVNSEGSKTSEPQSDLIHIELRPEI
jgi:hypothetical protein